jgi:hypothetical protein
MLFFRYDELGFANSSQDIVGTALYLTSRAGAYVNGGLIILDGGSTAITPSTY